MTAKKVFNETQEKHVRTTLKNPENHTPTTDEIVSMDELSTQVSVTVPVSFLFLFEEVTGKLGYSRPEAIREGMRRVMADCTRKINAVERLVKRIQNLEEFNKRVQRSLNQLLDKVKQLEKQGLHIIRDEMMKNE